MADQKVKVGVELDTSKAQQQLKDLFDQFNQFGRLTNPQSQSVSDISNLLSSQNKLLDIKKRISNENDKAIRDTREINRLSNRVLESTAGALGGYQARHGIRAISGIQELQQAMSASSGSEVGLAAVFGEVATSAVALIPELAVFVVAVEGAKMAFKMVEQAAMQVASGMARIGGVRGLDQLLVDSASTQRQAALLARLSSSPMSRGQAFNLIEENSGNSRFSSSEVSKLFIDFAKGSGGAANLLGQSVSGGSGTFGKGLLEIANVYDPNNPQVAVNALAKYRAMTGADANQTLDFGMRALYAQQQGGLDFFANSNAFSKLINEGKGPISQEMTAATLFARGLGGTDRSDVSKLLKYEKQGGGTDSASLARSIVGGQGDFSGIRNFVKEQGVDVSKEKDVKEFIDKMNDGSNAAKSFTQALIDAQGTVEDKWRTAVNMMSSQIESALLPVLVALTPEIQELTKYITDHKDEIAESIKQLGHGLILLAEGAVAFSSVIFSVVDKIMATVFPDAAATGRSAQEELTAGGETVADPGGSGVTSFVPYSDAQMAEFRRQAALGKMAEQVHQQAIAEANGASAGAAAEPEQKRSASGEKDPTSEHARQSVVHLQDISDVTKRVLVIQQQMDDNNKKNTDRLINAINISKTAVGTPAHPDKK